MGEVNEFPGEVLRVFGPPGTGKTTYLARMIYGLVRDDGPESTLVCSFSTTAAHAVTEKFGGDNVVYKPNKKMVGTLHSHAYRAMGHGNVALDPKIIKDWNEQATPEMRITADKRGSGGDTGKFVTDPTKAVTGDDHLGCLDLLRAKMIPADEWPRNIAEFAGQWEAWKKGAGAVDFSDMIEGALQRARDGEPAPGRPQFIISDESQDMTPLETSLVLAWGLHATRTVLAGDDDQAINGWRGGSPGPMVTLNGPNVSDHMLTKSHRVPENVRLIAEEWIRRVSFRKEKTYTARTRRDGDTDTGEIIGGTAFGVPESLGSKDLVVRINRDLDAGKDVMVIASCNYMLEPLLTNLREEGVPFHNPYRPAEMRWNPLGGGRDDTMSTAERVYRYLVLSDRVWTGDDIRAWMELVKIKDAGMVSTAKQMITSWGRDPVPYEDVEALFKTAEAFEWAAQPDPDWLASCLLKSKADYAAYPLEVARQHGHKALAGEPKVVVGTVHSVKGAGADVVYLAPDMSAAARRSVSESANSRDEVIRQFYVGMTRSKESLRVLAPNGGPHMMGLIPTRLEAM
jgi:superfamily I DNA/RNA helicase